MLDVIHFNGKPCEEAYFSRPIVIYRLLEWEQINPEYSTYRKLLHFVAFTK